MKVYELIQKLMEIPAGADVYVTDRPGGMLNDIGHIECEQIDDATAILCIYGEGVESECTEDD